MRSTKEVDEEIASVEATKARVHADKQHQAEALKTIKQICEQQADKALAAGHIEAAKLEKALADQEALQRKIAKADMISAAADKRIVELRNERQQSYRVERLAEFKQLGEEAKTEAHWLATAISGLGEQVTKHGETMRQLHAMADELEISSGALRLVHFFRFLDCELHRVSRDFPKPSAWENYKNQRYDSWLERVVDGRVVPDDDEEIKKSA